MRICVHGLWHLGTVTACCLAAMGHEVVGFDDDRDLIDGLRKGEPPIFEPGLKDLLGEGLTARRLRFTNDTSDALQAIEYYWATFDTPVNEDNVADVEYVTQRVGEALAVLPHDCLALISSQVPVGTTRRLAQTATLRRGEQTTSVCYLPENLRLGRAIEIFMQPDRIVVGLSEKANEARIRRLFEPIAPKFLFMSLESAEMAKHAINSFLATSVVFANEIGAVCEMVGADAADVAAALKSEHRIGPYAYVSPGAAFAGGTLARDIAFLEGIGNAHDLRLDMLRAVATSNEAHKNWAVDRLHRWLGGLSGKKIALLGLTYKDGTDTLRASPAIAIARDLHAAGAVVRGFDPAIRTLEGQMRDWLSLASTAEDAAKETDGLVVCTNRPEFTTLDWDALASAMTYPLVLDPNGVLAAQFVAKPGLFYASVGRRFGPQDARMDGTQ